MSADPKRRKIDASSSRRPSFTLSEKKEPATSSKNKSTIHAAEASNIHLRIQQAKDFAVAQAQQEGCTGNFRVFDSPFGNFLVPVIPTRTELSG